MNKYLNKKRAIYIVLILFATALIIYLPKIYLLNNIYYTSKDINKVNRHYISLKEENKFLIQQLEDMKFKNQVVDSLLVYELDSK